VSYYRITLKADGGLVAGRVRVADSFWGRFRGLMFSPHLLPEEGLLLIPCTSIHMLFMRYPIDAAFLTDDDRVVACYHSLRPWTGLSGWHRDAGKVLELASGALSSVGVKPGEQLFLERID